MRGLASEFKNFLARGNVVDLAVAVVLGTAFGVVIKALVADLLTPIIALIFGQPDFGALSFTINSSHFYYGDFINSLITFVSVAAAIFFFVVKPYNTVSARTAKTAEVTTRSCPACLTEVPLAATRCSACTSDLPAISPATDS